MRKYTFLIKNDEGEMITKYILANTKKEAMKSMKNSTYFINGKIYKIIKNSLKWAE